MCHQFKVFPDESDIHPLPLLFFGSILFFPSTVHYIAGQKFNSLAPGISECDSENVNFNLVLLIDISRSSHDNALRWLPQDLTDDKSTLVQVMAWCHQATSHYLSKCWLSSLSPYGVARPQWVNVSFNTLRPRQHGRHFQMHFLEWKCMNFDYDFTEVCSWGSN